MKYREPLSRYARLRLADASEIKEDFRRNVENISREARRGDLARLKAPQGAAWRARLAALRFLPIFSILAAKRALQAHAQGHAETRIPTQSLPRFLIVAALLVLISGCVRIDIGGAQKPTLGSQLMDLYRAEQAGAITDQQFKSLSARLLSATID